MKTISLHYPFDQQQIPAEPVVLAMGFFDGVHRGHQAVINRAKKVAEERHQPLAVLTYDKLPAIVFKQLPGRVQYLSPLRTKLKLLEQLGVDITYVVDFTGQFASLAPQQFVDEILMSFHPSAVVAGFDHTYGPKDVATMQRLPEYAKGRFDIFTVDKLAAPQEAVKIGSTRIRHLIDHGDIEQANEQLGYAYMTTGTVVHGFARGRTIGFPTANIEWAVDERIPVVGVYATQVLVDGRWYNGMASVGHNETFGDDFAKTIEINLLDFNQNIYGEHVVVRWIKHLRDEVKFSSVEQLVDQLKRDQLNTQQVLQAVRPTWGLG